MPWESAPVVLTAMQKKELKKVATDSNSLHREKCRALIVLLLGEGLKNKEIANRLRIHENTVVKWRGRWTGDNESSTIQDYGELTGRPRSVLIDSTLNKIEKITQSNPPKGKNRWTVRSIAEKMKMPVATVQRALVELDIKLYKIS